MRNQDNFFKGEFDHCDNWELFQKNLKRQKQTGQGYRVTHISFGVTH